MMADGGITELRVADVVFDPTPAFFAPLPSSRTLVDEYLAAMGRMRLANALELVDLGVPMRAITLVCPAPVRVSLSSTEDGGDLYSPDEGGRPAWVFPVHAVDSESPAAIETVDPLAGICRGPVYDLVAFSPFAPNCWALRLGLASVLGAIAPQCFEPEPVLVHRDIAGWQRSGCCGIVLLTRDPHARARILRQIVHVEAEDDQHAAELRRLLALPAPVHSVVMVREGNEWRRRQPLG